MTDTTDSTDGETREKYGIEGGKETVDDVREKLEWDDDEDDEDVDGDLEPRGRLGGGHR